MSTLFTEDQSLPSNVRREGIHPQKFALWIAIATMIMSFAGLTSAYIVRKGAGNWVEFQIPHAFYASTLFILLSSVMMIWAHSAFKKGDLSQYRISLSFTFTLALAFLFAQILGYRQLEQIGIYLDGNPSGSFLYVISGLHILHLAFGILFLFIAWIRSLIQFKNLAQWQLWSKNPEKLVRLELLTTYWHFVDLLWLYLILFFHFS